MNSNREDHRQDPLTPAAAPAAPGNAPGSNPPTHLPRPPDCQRLATGMRDTWLYRFSPSGTGGVYWEAGMRLDGKVLQRRFAAELHARAWLTVISEPRPRAILTDLEEHHGLIRAAALLRGGAGVVSMTASARPWGNAPV